MNAINLQYITGTKDGFPWEEFTYLHISLEFYLFVDSLNASEV